MNIMINNMNNMNVMNNNMNVSTTNNSPTKAKRQPNVLLYSRELLKCQRLLSNAWDTFHVSPQAAGCAELESGDSDDCSKLLSIPTMTTEGLGDHDSIQYTQLSTSGAVAKDVSELYWAAAIAKPFFDNFLRSLVHAVGMNVRHDLVLPAIKSQKRTAEKIKNNHKDPSRIYDVVRASVVCKTVPELLSFLNALMTAERESYLYQPSGEHFTSDEDRNSKNSTQQDNFNISFVRLKNRFASPTIYGYRDILINIRMTIAEGVHHITELQLHLRPLYEIYTRKHINVLYDYFDRDYFHRNVQEGQADQRLQLLKRLAAVNNAGEAASLTSDVLKTGDVSLVHGFKCLLLDMDHHAEAELCQRRVLEALQAQHQQDPRIQREYFDALFQLVQILERKQVYVEAEEMCRRVVVGYERILTKASAATVDAMFKLGKILMAQKRCLDEATKAFQYAAGFYEMTLGESDPTHVLALEHVADCLVVAENFGEAELVLRKIATALEKTVLANRSGSSVAGGLDGRGSCRGAAAINAASAASNVVQQQKEFSEVKYIDSIINLAVVLERNRHYAEAKTRFEKAVSLKKQRNDANDVVTVKILDYLASINESLLDFDEAERLHTANYQLRVRLFGENHMSTVISLLNIAEVYMRTEKFGRAAECYHQVKEILELNLGEGNAKAKQAAKKAKRCLQEANRHIAAKSYNEARSHIMLNVQGPGVERKFAHMRQCENCEFEYTMLNREHHCRLCVRSVCASCSPSTAYIPLVAQSENQKKRVRVCTPCHQAINVYNSAKAANPMRISSTTSVKGAMTFDERSLSVNHRTSSVYADFM